MIRKTEKASVGSARRSVPVDLDGAKTHKYDISDD